MNGRDFFVIAEAFQKSDLEAQRRTSIGRSYYALYNAVLQTLEAQNLPFSGKAEDHGRLAYYLKTPQDRLAYKVGEALTALRFDRNNADYGMKATISATKSELVYRQAKNALLLLDQINVIALANKIRQLPPYRPNS